MVRAAGEAAGPDALVPDEGPVLDDGVVDDGVLDDGVVDDAVLDDAAVDDGACQDNADGGLEVAEPVILGEGDPPGGRWPGVAVVALLTAWVAAAAVGMTVARHQVSSPPLARAQPSSAPPAAAGSSSAVPASGQAATARPAQPGGRRALAGAARRPVTVRPPAAGPSAAAPASQRAGKPSATLPAALPPVAAPRATAGWWTYADPSGFTIKLPPGWSAGPRTATHITFSGPRPGFTVLVWWTTAPQPDQLADWRQQAAYKAQTDPTYRQLGIGRVSYRGYNSANWEFSNSYQGQTVHVLDHGFIVTPGALAYAIELYGPQAGWGRVRAGVWAGLLDSFTTAR